MEPLKKIGPYEIIREIGRGGMGVVYLVKHPTLGIDVALKAFFPDPSRGSDDPELITAQNRFRNEAQITAKLKHPNIVNVYDFGLDQNNGVLFIIMDYLDGGTLKERIKRNGKLSPAEAVEIIKPVANALDYIQKQAIYHRDLKPSNILFLAENPVLTDFGIATDEYQGTIQTETNRLVGSVAYMAPERFTSQNYDHRSDIFALGVIIYEMMTGENPFYASTLAEISSRIKDHRPPLLSKVNSEVPDFLAGLVNHMIEKEPDQRLDKLDKLLKLNIHPRLFHLNYDESSKLRETRNPISPYPESPGDGNLYVGRHVNDDVITKLPDSVSKEIEEREKRRRIFKRNMLIVLSIVAFYLILWIIVLLSSSS